MSGKQGMSPPPKKRRGKASQKCGISVTKTRPVKTIFLELPIRKRKVLISGEQLAPSSPFSIEAMTTESLWCSQPRLLPKCGSLFCLAWPDPSSKFGGQTGSWAFAQQCFMEKTRAFDVTLGSISAAWIIPEDPIEHQGRVCLCYLQGPSISNLLSDSTFLAADQAATAQMKVKSFTTFITPKLPPPIYYKTLPNEQYSGKTLHVCALDVPTSFSEGLCFSPLKLSFFCEAEPHYRHGGPSLAKLLLKWA